MHLFYFWWLNKRLHRFTSLQIAKISLVFCLKWHSIVFWVFFYFLEPKIWQSALLDSLLKHFTNPVKVSVRETFFRGTDISVISPFKHGFSDSESGNPDLINWVRIDPRSVFWSNSVEIQHLFGFFEVRMLWSIQAGIVFDGWSLLS